MLSVHDINRDAVDNDDADEDDEFDVTGPPVLDVRKICWVGMAFSGAALVAAPWLRWASGVGGHARVAYLAGVLLAGNLSLWVLMLLQDRPESGEFVVAVVLFGLAASMMYTSVWSLFCEFLEPEAEELAAVEAAERATGATAAVAPRPERLPVAQCVAGLWLVEHVLTRFLLHGVFNLERLLMQFLHMDARMKYRVHWGVSCLLAALLGLGCLLTIKERVCGEQTRGRVSQQQQQQPTKEGAAEQRVETSKSV